MDEQNNIRLCENCGNTVFESASFCGHCGYSLSCSETVGVVSPKKKRKKLPFFIGGFLLLVVVVVAFFITVCFHDWQPATCTEPKTCKKCKVTEGVPLEHDVEVWSTVFDSTCSEEGVEEGVCVRCNLITTQAIKTKQHTKGNWEVTKKPTKNSKGQQSIKCIVCETVLETQEYVLSQEEIKSDYIASCGKYSYEWVARYPDELKNSRVKFYGKVLQVIKNEFGNKISYDLRVGTEDRYYTDDIIYVTYTANKSEPRILEDDMITIYGELGGDYTYESVLGSEITLPLIYAEYID